MRVTYQRKGKPMYKGPVAEKENSTFKKLKEDHYSCTAKIKKPGVRGNYKEEQGADHTGPSRPRMQRTVGAYPNVNGHLSEGLKKGATRLDLRFKGTLLATV